ncbi:hypothetical protein SKAU_G00050650 [Synaphobranchus kaupii]|uniref:Reverse transcriptase domain-containing protein n=1 Tax=Synaphobranchus kaupii TaxID=118154 RepID=A0A9Q1G340_SYNKA|nr:hypothetical protein SKAU_G00050650 [Synaphobranchus kaupii]
MALWGQEVGQRPKTIHLSLERVPDLWKTSCVLPIPKTAHPREPNHFRPVALTSHLLKTMERIMLNHLRPLLNSLERVPDLWKTSCVLLIPKTAHPREPNHFRPVALTSHLMKTMERIMLNHLRPLVSTKLDPQQFAYQPGIGVDDAVIYLQHRSLSHLESSGSYVRVMFFDFSSAFDTIQPSLLRGKLEGAGVDHHLTAWIINYLTSRPQYVRLHDCV